MTAFATLLATLALIALYTFIDILVSKKIFWVKNISFAVFSFFGAFLIVSGALFAFDAYSFRTAYGICAAVGAGVVFGIWLYSYRGQQGGMPRYQEYPQYFMPCLAGLLILGTVLTLSKFEHYGMGQDQGVYQTTAMFRTAGYNSIEIDLPGYHALTDEADRALYQDIMDITRTSITGIPELRTLLGFYKNTYDIRLNFEPSSEVSGVMHGIPNFGALLSISGRIFGVSGMSHLNTLFIMASICLMFLTLSCNLKLKISTSTMITALFIISPIVIWTFRSALTEPVLTLLMIAFIYLATSEDKYAKWLLWMPVTVFAFTHASIYTMMPMFVAVFLVMYMQSRGNGVFVSAIVSLTAYFAGFFVMLFAANNYTYSNYAGPLGSVIGFLNLDYRGFVVFVTGVTLFAVVLFALLCFFIRKKDFTLDSKTSLTVNKYAMLILLACALFWFVEYYRGRFPPTYIQVRMYASLTPHRTIISYTLLSGFIMLPIALYGIFKKHEDFGRKSTAVLVIMFLYCVLAYAAFLRPTIRYFYYYARYLTPFIPVILILAGVYIDKIKARAKSAIFAVSVALTIPFTAFVTIYKDHSRVDWKSFKQVVAAVDALDGNDIILVSEEAVKFFFLPLNAMTDSIILPGGYGDYEIINNRLSGGGQGKVFTLSMNGADGEYEGLMTQESTVFPARGSECTNLPGLIPPLPLGIRRTEFNICLTPMT